MPDQPSWLERVPDILAELDAADSLPFLDRPAVERLFRLRRRQAIRLMGACGGYQVGRAFLVDRAQLVLFLNRFSESGAVASAVRRKRRILDQIDQAQRHLAARRVSIPVQSNVFDIRFANLPAGIQLDRNRLSITFDQPVELLEKLFALAQALSNDFGAFERLLKQEPAI